jgi:hypothetical protein
MFLVLSSICTNSKPLDYHPVRSVFSAEDRLKQTLETIESIRKFTDHRIIHVECGNHKQVGFDLSVISSRVDQFLDLSDNPYILSCVNSPHKSWAELIKIHTALQNTSDDGFIFKISGRYTLTEDFDQNSFYFGDISAKVFSDHGPMRCCSVLYSMKDVVTYREFCSTAKSKFQQNKYVSMEEMLYDWAKNKNLSIKETLGCRGLISVSGCEWRA